MVLTVFLVEICVMLGQESCNEVHSVVVVMLGRLLVFFTWCCVSCHSFLVFWFSSNRCSVL